MRARKLLGAFVVAGALATTPACLGTTSEYVTADTPPPPREEVVSVQPGTVWIHGNWGRVNSKWVWHAGHAEADRPGYLYGQGHWERNGQSYVWINGTWHRVGMASS